ncbi:MAG: hypothetical protein LDL53_06370 [Candidatus Hydrogenedens sp.]|nr:hypothetical protein [Candidatus Hydrogenedens sp.]
MSMIFVGMVLIVSNFHGIDDIPYEHFFHEPLPVEGLPDLSGSVTLPLCVIKNKFNKVYLGTSEGLFLFSEENNQWVEVSCLTEKGPIFALKAINENLIYIGAWNGFYIMSNGKSQKVDEIGDVPISAIDIVGERIIVGGPDGIWLYQPDHGWQKKEMTIPRSIRNITLVNADNFWIATEIGLVYVKGGEKIHYQHKEDKFSKSDEEKELISNNLLSLCSLSNDELWAGGLGGITVLRNEKVKYKYLYHEFPGATITKIVYDPLSGRIWIGTNNGLVLSSHEQNKPKKVFRSRRWLLDNHVSDIALSNNNVYISTSKGVSRLRIENKTLYEKATVFEEIARNRHTRPPGIVEKCLLPKRGDISIWEPVDDDNDGGYTCMYLAGLSFQYAVTNDEAIRQRAKEIFKAILFLEQVTELPGFIARTVVPSDWKRVSDANEQLTPQQKATMKVVDPRYKPVEERWRLSKDGKWLWKGDTSSDEITAHFFGWSIYYDLCADEENKQLLQQLVKRVMDKIISDGYVLKDIDGHHTRWGVWAPERLKHDPDWTNERGINALEILSYLKASYHITGDEKYQNEYERLLTNEGYAQIVRRAKNYGHSSITHIDDELLAFTYPALFRYEKDEQLLNIYRESIQHWYRGIENEQCPLYNFIYAWCMGSDPHLEESTYTLRDIPFDLINWTVDNRFREDIKLVREPILEDVQTSRLLPPSETAVIRWDKNRWEAVQGDGGSTEWAPTFYLFPYWLGRYLGVIK